MTVNVNFPESAVQQATDDYVRELYRAKAKSTPSATPPKSTSALSPGEILEALLPSAEAASGDFKVNTPKALEIRERLAARLDEVLSAKRAGSLGENQDGYLEVHGADSVKKLLLKRLERLASEENRDRKDLYEEVVTSNGLPQARIKDVQKSFARSFQAESPAGTWVQDADGKWSQKP